jgi:hypothetical protein
MKTLPKELFAKYASDPLKYDEEVRSFAEIPDNRYYNVSMWPEELAGRVYVRTPTDKDKARVVKAKKVSKSDQQ